MRKWGYKLLVAVWLFVCPLAFAIVWLNTPALWFITLPQSVSVFLVKSLEISCCEGIADLEFVVGLFFGFVFALILLWLFFLIRRFWLSRRSGH